MIKNTLILLAIILTVIIGIWPTKANKILTYIFIGIITITIIALIIKFIIYLKDKKEEKQIKEANKKRKEYLSEKLRKEKETKQQNHNYTKFETQTPEEYSQVIKDDLTSQINAELTKQALEDIKKYSKIYTPYKEPIIKKEDETYSEYLKEKRLNEEQEFYEKQIKKLSKCEKLYYDVLYNHYKDKYLIESQVYLRSMFPRMGAENHRIDIVFKDKQWEEPILLIEINDETHSRNPVTRMRDKDLKEFCKEHDIKLQALWTKFGVNKYSIIKLIDKKLKE